jgi:hypothetical protein
MTTRLIRKIPHPSVETRDDPFNASAFGGDGNLLRLVEDDLEVLVSQGAALFVDRGFTCP